jgi:hypothetical protein
MYGKKKKAIKLATRTKKIAFHKFVPWRRVGDSDKDTLYAVDSRNCNCLDGTMRVGVGLKVHTNSSGKVVKYAISETEIDYFFFTHKHLQDDVYQPMLCCLTKTGEYYFAYFDSTDFIEYVGMQLLSVNQIDYFLTADNEPYVMFFGEAGINMVQLDVWERAEKRTPVQCGCVWNDRAYAVIAPYTLIYSAPLEPLDFSDTIHDSGRIYFSREAGNAVAIKPLNGKLYIFSEYGITELEPSGSATDFKQRKIAYQGGRIVPGSIGECRGKLYFFALDGVYAFDGRCVEKKFRELRLKGKDATKKCGWATSGNGFLLRYCDEKNFYRTVYLDPEKDSGYRTADFCALSMADGRAVCGRNKMMYYILENEALPSGENAFFQSEPINFGSKKRKLLTGIRLTGEGAASLNISTGNTSVTLGINFSKGAVNLSPQLFGQEFQFKISLSAGGSVSGFEVEAECI